MPMDKKHRGPIRPTILAWSMLGCLIFWILAYYLFPWPA